METSVFWICDVPGCGRSYADAIDCLSHERICREAREVGRQWASILKSERGLAIALKPEPVLPKPPG